jgi:hypothetical protein
MDQITISATAGPPPMIQLKEASQIARRGSALENHKTELVTSALSTKPGTVRRIARRRPYLSAKYPYGIEQMAPISNVSANGCQACLQTEIYEHNKPSNKSE